MFWGLILKANKKYTQLLEKPFHLTKASLDYSTADDAPVQVMYFDGQSTFLLCTLQKDKELQCTLDLSFAEGDTVCFSTKGNGIVHLTGYLIPEDDDFNYEGLDGEQEDSVEEEEESELEDEKDIRKDLRELLKKKQKQKDAGKKSKKGAEVEESDDSEDDDSEDEVANGDSSLNSSGIQEDDDDEDDSDDDDEDDDEDMDDDDSDEEEEAVAPPPKKQVKLDPQQQKKQQNGVEKNGQDKKKNKDKKEKPQVAEKPQKEQQAKKENKQADNKIQKLQGGLVIQDLKPGSGAEAKPGKKIQVYYEGRLKSNNKVFDSTKSGAGFKLTLGRGEVIKGWDLGLAGMKVGGKRRITCPPGLAYGAKGNPPVIPANSTLVFDVELKNVL